MKQQTIEWREVEKDFEEESKSYFYFYFRYKAGNIKIKKIKFDRNPKKLQEGSGGPLGIKIDTLFFKFKDKERVALLWHELFHSKIFTWLLIKDFLKIKAFFKRKNSKHEEEFLADKYSALNNSIKDCLSYLFKIKEIYSIKPELYNPETHPSIDERIKKIKELENETTK